MSLPPDGRPSSDDGDAARRAPDGSAGRTPDQPASPPPVHHPTRRELREAEQREAAIRAAAGVDRDPAAAARPEPSPAGTGDWSLEAAEAQIAAAWRQRAAAAARTSGVPAAGRRATTGPAAAAPGSTAPSDPATPTVPASAVAAPTAPTPIPAPEPPVGRPRPAQPAQRRPLTEHAPPAEHPDPAERLQAHDGGAVGGFEALLHAVDHDATGGGRSGSGRAPSGREARRREPEAGDEFDGRPPRRRRGAIGCLVALLVIVALAVVGFFLLKGPVEEFLARFEPPADYSGTGTGEVDFTISDGDTGDVIARNLHAQGVTASYEAFYELISAQSPTFYPGVYRLAKEMSAQAAFVALQDEANRLENTFVLPEGIWAVDALQRAADGTGIPLDELQAAAADPAALGLPAEATSVEGFLFPATYTFGPGTSAQEVVQTLVDRSLQAFDEAGVPPEDRWHVAIIASLLEREAGLRDDYFKVSRVIQNRLDPELFPSGLLQFDSTVHYGIGDDSVVTTTPEDRADAGNPFNTYVHPGLPPGPIGNPGDLAIDAALHPADGPWLYFVTVDPDTGETVFSATLEEHEAAVERFQAWLAEHPEFGQ